MGKKVIKVSLNTLDKRTAGKLAAQMAARNKELFRELRENKDKPLDPNELKYELYRFMEKLVNEDEIKRAERANVQLHPALANIPNLPTYHEETATSLLLEELQAAHYNNDFMYVASYVDNFIEASGFRVEPDSTAYNQIARGVLEALIKLHRVTLARSQSDVVAEGMLMSNIMQPVPKPVPVEVSPRLSEVFEKWREAHVAVGGAPKTINDFRTQIARFIGFHGDMQVHKVTQTHVVEFKDAVLRLPSRMTNEERALPFSEQVGLTASDPDRSTISPRTVNEKVLGAVSAVLGHAHSEMIIPFNPASKIKVKNGKRAALPRLPYSSDDLNAILHFPIYTEGERPRGGAGEASVWLPLLAMYTGARLEELGQIRTEDIKREKDIWFIDMLNLEETREEPEHRFKNAQSRRRVPIHNQLLGLGFLDYVQFMKERDTSRIFPYLQSSTDQITASYSKWWGRYARKHGGFGKQKVFHSFRHSAKDALRDAEIDSQVFDALQGHAPTTEGQKYGSGHSLKVLKNAVDKLEYDVDLSHLDLKPRS